MSNVKNKIFILLLLIPVWIIRTYFSPKKTRKALEGKPLFVGIVIVGLIFNYILHF